MQLLHARGDIDADFERTFHGCYAIVVCQPNMGMRAVVTLLLVRDDLDTDSKDFDGESPLSFELENPMVVTLLLAHLESDSDRRPIPEPAITSRESSVCDSHILKTLQARR